MKEIELKKQKEIEKLQNTINETSTKKKDKKAELDSIKIDEKKKKIEEEKRKKSIKENEKKEKEAEINKELEKKKEKEDLIKDVNININETKKKLNDKEAIIKSKNEEANRMTKALEEIYMQDQKNLQAEKETLEKELKKNKDNAIRHLLIIKIINEEIEKLTLNKSTINSVFELINQLSLNKKFIDNRKYFNEVIEDYKNIVQKLNESNNKNEIYKKYGLDADSIRKIEKREK